MVMLALLCGRPVGAQTLPEDRTLVPFKRYVSVRERRLKGYETPPIPVGSFNLQPSVNVSLTYNDNVLARQDDRPGDAFVRVSPAATLTSDWSGSLLSVSAAADIDRYADLSTENSENFNTSVYATHDLGRATVVRGLGRFEAQRESRESQDIFVETLRPVRFRRATAALGVSHQLANTLLSVEANLTETDFDDAVLRSTRAPVDEDFRDSTRKQIRGRAEFGQSPALAYFVQATYSDRNYRRRDRDPLASGRGSQVTELLAGARFELPILARGEVGVGYTTGKYGGAAFNTFSGLAIRSNVTFFPTQLTNVIVTAERQVTDSGLPGSSGYTSLVGGVRVEHELLRPLLLSAGLRYQRERFNGVDRLDRRWQVDAGASYRLGRYMSVNASFQRLDLSSTGANRYKSFIADRVLIGLGLRV